MLNTSATGPVPSIGVGDFVTFDGRTGDVWEVVADRHGDAKLAARSIHLAGRPGRVIAFERLVRYDPSGSEPDDVF